MGMQAFSNNFFLAELCKYYLAFLETDFKETRDPNRKIVIHDENKLLASIKLANYPGLNQAALSLIHDKFSQNPFGQIENKKYILRFPDTVISQIKNRQTDAKRSPLQIIKTYLEKQALPHRAKILNELRQKLRDKTIKDAQSLSRYILSDFYNELHDLWANKHILDKQNFYLYFLDIKFENNLYPLFYIPLKIHQSHTGSFHIEYESTFLINKKAIQYISYRYAKDRQRQWKMNLPPRHIALDAYETPTDFLGYLQKILDETCNFLELPLLNLSLAKAVQSQNERIQITNNCYFVLFDQSDKALLNDYEELLRLSNTPESTKMLDFLNKVTRDYIFINPKTFEKEVKNEYDNQPIDNKRICPIPIPLNKEQLQILKALDKDECDRISVEAPPGTGKSHMITAIIYNAIFKNKSVLLVSDKEEALDAVENKITAMLNSYQKTDDFIPTPLFRPGKNRDYTKIFNPANYEKIKTRFRNYRLHKKRLEAEIKVTLSTIKNRLFQEAEALLSMTPERIKSLLSYESTYNRLWKERIDPTELFEKDLQGKLLYQLWHLLAQLKIDYTWFFQNYQIDLFTSISTFEALKKRLLSLERDVKMIDNKLSSQFPRLVLHREISRKKVVFLESCFARITESRLPLVGNLFSHKQLAQLEKEFKQNFPLSGIDAFRKNQDYLKQELLFYQFCEEINQKWQVLQLDLLRILQATGFEALIGTLNNLIVHLNAIINIIQEIPATTQKSGIHPADVKTLLVNDFNKIDAENINALMDYFTDQAIINIATENLMYSDFKTDRKVLQKHLLYRTFHILDEKVVHFRETEQNDAFQLKEFLENNRRIPKHLLEKLLRVFPCFLSELRELGSIVPLEPDIFDIVIIDEASQVNISQAFPAILRGKKVVVLGDSKQFSNVKSCNASPKINQFLLNQVKQTFLHAISNLEEAEQDSIKDNIDNFNAKNSILDFIKNITNFQINLKKHFRSYPEIIGYPNEIFYQNALQIIKIRTKPITDVIRFCQTASPDTSPNAKKHNQAEAAFILEELQRLKEKSFQGTVGIITPFIQQQKLISNYVYRSKNWQFYTEKFQLKIMTFDSCQGEERDIVYYSMVERANQNILSHLFPQKLPLPNDDTEEQLKVQRLNAGLSIAKEGIRFVLSKNETDISGVLGKVLQFYREMEKEPQNEKGRRTTMQSSPERYLYNLITQTPFFTRHKRSIKLISQSDIANYIQQLNPQLPIPEYRSSLLFIYSHTSGKTISIIIEYDGYEFHFKDADFLSKLDYNDNYVEQEIEKQKTLESYGYYFIRFNKFLLGNHPVAYLNQQLEKYCQP